MCLNVGDVGVAILCNTNCMKSGWGGVKYYNSNMGVNIYISSIKAHTALVLVCPIWCGGFYVYMT